MPTSKILETCCSRCEGVCFPEAGYLWQLGIVNMPAFILMLPRRLRKFSLIQAIDLCLGRRSGPCAAAPNTGVDLNSSSLVLFLIASDLPTGVRLRLFAVASFVCLPPSLPRPLTRASLVILLQGLEKTLFSPETPLKCGHIKSKIDGRHGHSTIHANPVEEVGFPVLSSGPAKFRKSFSNQRVAVFDRGRFRLYRST